MTLATKNGSLIVKNGSLAENCGCCGGWYCCPDYRSCPVEDIVSSVTVAVSGTEYREVLTINRAKCSASPYPVYGKQIWLSPNNLLSGTFALAKTGSSTWRHSYSSDSAGGVAYIEVSFTNTSLAQNPQLSGSLILSSPTYTWSKISAGSGSSASVLNEDKSLADMSFSLSESGLSSYFTAGANTNGGCFSSPYEGRRGVTGTQPKTFAVSGTKCGGGISSAIASISQFHPPTLPSTTVGFGPLWEPFDFGDTGHVTKQYFGSFDVLFAFTVTFK